MAVAKKDERKISWFCRTISFQVVEEESVEETVASNQEVPAETEAILDDAPEAQAQEEAISDEPYVPNAHLAEAITQYLQKNAPEVAANLRSYKVEEFPSPTVESAIEQFFNQFLNTSPQPLFKVFHLLKRPNLKIEERLALLQTAYFDLFHLSILIVLSQLYPPQEEIKEIKKLQAYFTTEEKVDSLETLKTILQISTNANIPLYPLELKELSKLLQQEKYQIAANFFEVPAFSTITSSTEIEEKCELAEQQLAAILPDLLYSYHYSWKSIRNNIGEGKPIPGQQRFLFSIEYYSLQGNVNFNAPEVSTYSRSILGNAIILQEQVKDDLDATHISLNPFIFDLNTTPPERVEDQSSFANPSRNPSLLFFRRFNLNKSEFLFETYFGSDQKATINIESQGYEDLPLDLEAFKDLFLD